MAYWIWWFFYSSSRWGKSSVVCSQWHWCFSISPSWVPFFQQRSWVWDFDLIIGLIFVLHIGFISFVCKGIADLLSNKDQCRSHSQRIDLSYVEPLPKSWPNLSRASDSIICHEYTIIMLIRRPLWLRKSMFLVRQLMWEFLRGHCELLQQIWLLLFHLMRKIGKVPLFEVWTNPSRLWLQKI